MYTQISFVIIFWSQ